MPAVLSTLRKQDAPIGPVMVESHIADFGPTVGLGQCEKDPRRSIGDKLFFTIVEGPMSGALVACNRSDIAWRDQTSTPIPTDGFRICEGCHDVQRIIGYGGDRKPRRSHCPSAHHKFRLCGRCSQVYYCSVDCARLHWPEHQRTCHRRCT